MAISGGKKRQKQQRRNNSEIKYLKNEEWVRLIETIDNYRDKLIVNLNNSQREKLEFAKLLIYRV